MGFCVRNLSENDGFRAVKHITSLTSESSLIPLVSRGNHLEHLKGDRENQYSIRINQQYRICFTGRKAMPTRSKLQTTTDVGRRLPRKRPSIHPGESFTQTELARCLEVSYPRLNEIKRVFLECIALRRRFGA